MRVTATTLVVLLGFALAPAPVAADVVVLTADRDSTLYEPEDEKANERLYTHYKKLVRMKNTLNMTMLDLLEKVGQR